MTTGHVCHVHRRGFGLVLQRTIDMKCTKCFVIEVFKRSFCLFIYVTQGTQIYIIIIFVQVMWCAYEWAEESDDPMSLCEIIVLLNYFYDF